MNRVRYHHFPDSRLTMAVVEDGDKPCRVGLALAASGDHWSRSMGRLIAAGRARKQHRVSSPKLCMCGTASPAGLRNAIKQARRVESYAPHSVLCLLLEALELP